jgi:hypothetical protein
MPVDFDQRVLELIDRMDKKIDDLCERTTVLEQSLTNHFEIIKQSQESKQRKFYMLFGFLSVAFATYQAIKEFLL